MAALTKQIQNAIDAMTINQILDDVQYDDNVDVDTVTVVFRDALPAEEKTALDDILGLHDGEPLPSNVTEVHITNERRDADGRLEIVQEKRRGTDLTIASHKDKRGYGKPIHPLSSLFL